MQMALTWVEKHLKAELIFSCTDRNILCISVTITHLSTQHLALTHYYQQAMMVSSQRLLDHCGIVGYEASDSAGKGSRPTSTNFLQ